MLAAKWRLSRGWEGCQLPLVALAGVASALRRAGLHQLRGLASGGPGGAADLKPWAAAGKPLEQVHPPPDCVISARLFALARSLTSQLSYILNSLTNLCLQAATIPSSWYTDPRVLALELERVFKPAWQVGMVGMPSQSRFRTALASQQRRTLGAIAGALAGAAGAGLHWPAGCGRRLSDGRLGSRRALPGLPRPAGRAEGLSQREAGRLIRIELVFTRPAFLRRGHQWLSGPDSGLPTNTAAAQVCRHHAAAVAAGSGRGSVAFRCPYHGWTYGLDGRLQKAVGLKGIEGFRAAENGLVPLAAAALGPWLFGSLAAASAISQPPG